jgi:hypothetical protein
VTDAIPSDHPAVDSYRVELAAVGSTNRAQLSLPAELDCAEGDFVRLVVADQQTHAKVVSTLAGERAIRAAYANKRLARTDGGTDRLREWLDSAGFGPGSTLVLDVLTPGYAYGLRVPGERVVYDPVEKPDSSLSDIAESLTE